MYEELIRNLRICQDGEHCDRCEFYALKMANGLNACTEELCKQAADAIEELSRVAETIPHRCECCVGCELEKQNGGCDHAFVLSPKRAMQYLIKPRWIPVTERLPEKRDWYLVLTYDLEYFVCDYIPSVNQWWALPGDDWIVSVTHWMPLPEPPKEEV